MRVRDWRSAERECWTWLVAEKECDCSRKSWVLVASLGVVVSCHLGVVLWV